LKGYETVDIDDAGLNETYAQPDKINYIDENGDYKIYEGGGSWKSYMLCPSLYVSFVLKKIFSQIGFQLLDKTNYSALFLNLVIIGLTNISDTWGYPIARDIPLNKFLPHYKISSFLLDLQNLLGIVFLFDDKEETVSIEFKTDLLLKMIINPISFNHGKVIMDGSKKKSGVQWEIVFNDNVMKAINSDTIQPKISDVGDFEFPLAEENKYRVLYFNSNYNLSVPGPNNTWIWEQFNDYEKILKQRLSGTEDYLKLKTNTSFLHNATDPDYCTIGAKLNSTKNMKPILLFVGQHKMVNRGEGYFHIVENYYYRDNIDWFRNSGFERVNKSWFEFIAQSKPIETTIILSNTQLAAWDWLKPIKIGNTLVLANELDINLSDNGDIQAKLKAYTL